MYFCGVSTDLKKLGLSVALLLPSMLLQAESLEDVTAGEEVNKTAVNQLRSSNRPTEQQAGSALSRVPQQLKRNIIPPPPPGPYMSSALRGYPVKAPSFSRNIRKPVSSSSRNINKPVYRVDPSHVPMDMFSPDIPWPKNLRGNKQQPPAPLYRPQVKRNDSNQQYRGADNAPSMRQDGLRRLPSGFVPNDPYNRGSSYRPNPNSNYGAGSVRPAYRVQKPRSNQSSYPN